MTILQRVDEGFAYLSLLRIADEKSPALNEKLLPMRAGPWD